VRIGTSQSGQQVYVLQDNTQGDYVTGTTLLDMSGQALQQFRFKPNEKRTVLDLSGRTYPAGIYLIACTTRTGRVICHKVVLGQ
jgi:hypothetical protein